MAHLCMFAYLTFGTFVYYISKLCHCSKYKSKLALNGAQIRSL